MTGKIFYFSTFVSILIKTDTFKQLNANIATKHLMEDGNWTTSNDNDTHAYIIQKEREKLSIIPMFPIGIKSAINSVENQDDRDGTKFYLKRIFM